MERIHRANHPRELLIFFVNWLRHCNYAGFPRQPAANPQNRRISASAKQRERRVYSRPDRPAGA